MSASVRGVRRGVLADAAPARLGMGWWLVVLAVCIGAGMLDLATLPGVRRGSGIWIVIAIARVLTVLAVAYAVVRRIMRATPRHRDWQTFPRFVGLTVVLAIGFTMTQKIGAIAVNQLGEGNLANRWLAMLLVSAFWSVLLIRATAWSAALAAGRKFRVLPSLWRSLSGKWPILAIVYLQVILPLVAVHLALTLLSIELVLPHHTQIGLALIDGVVSATQLILTAALQQAALVLADRP